MPSTPSSTLWKYLFGRQARDLEQSNTAEDEYMISDADLPITKWVARLLHLLRLPSCAAPAAELPARLAPQPEHAPDACSLRARPPHLCPPRRRYVSVPKEMGHLNPAAFVAGIVCGALEGAGFPARWERRERRRQACACMCARHGSYISCCSSSLRALLSAPPAAPPQGDSALCAGAGRGAPQDSDSDEVHILCGGCAAGQAVALP